MKKFCKEYSIGDLLRCFLRHLVLICICSMLGIIVGFSATSFSQKTSFSATGNITMLNSTDGKTVDPSYVPHIVGSVVTNEVLFAFASQLKNEGVSDFDGEDVTEATLSKSFTITYSLLEDQSSYTFNLAFSSINSGTAVAVSSKLVDYSYSFLTQNFADYSFLSPKHPTIASAVTSKTNSFKYLFPAVFFCVSLVASVFADLHTDLLFDPDDFFVDGVNTHILKTTKENCRRDIPSFILKAARSFPEISNVNIVTLSPNQNGCSPLFLSQLPRLCEALSLEGVSFSFSSSDFVPKAAENQKVFYLFFVEYGCCSYSETQSLRQTLIRVGSLKQYSALVFLDRPKKISDLSLFYFARRIALKVHHGVK